MFRNFKQKLKTLLQRKPGNRFREAHKQVREETKGRPLRSVLYIILGVVFILVGFLLGFAPFLPGFVFGLLGLLLIVGQFRFAAYLLDKAELLLRRLFGKRHK